MKSVFDVVLYEPEIPPNTGNIIRLCANAGAALHLIEPLGFTLEDRLLRRAGLDYHEFAAVRVHPSLAAYLEGRTGGRLFACTTRGTVGYADCRFAPDDALLFGPESRGLPAGVLETIAPTQRLHIPMRPGNRSLNLSNAVAVVLFEAWRQVGFSGAAVRG
ncbi:tRNA (cytidine(34)-2'-O)-methyltransferase [Thiococcus pfennigii]|uniref:tRNA (cytidine(34)-2'-O)-methyltransferase n=1 Tax=Thiococcus pfennigii TaxID=1057 RepID=UPI00190346E7|nr:tRNA (cytidine(34)-2'-O)-methyltransferase [Thiococcus pfennigii]MBK1733159.1 tRNA (uridine(34)/cytosine(34)/5-carboxymethylaminomethyluridine(34)-2'-O)-methyltransferase TrmL [Thiococcus pfennigii]